VSTRLPMMPMIDARVMGEDRASPGVPSPPRSHPRLALANKHGPACRPRTGWKPVPRGMAILAMICEPRGREQLANKSAASLSLSGCLWEGVSQHGSRTRRVKGRNGCFSFWIPDSPGG